MDYSKYKRRKKEWIKLIAAWLLIAGVLGSLFYKSILGTLFILPFGLIYEGLDRKKKIERRKSELSYQFVEFLQVVISSLKAGASLERAVIGSKERLYSVYSAEDMIMKEISLMESGLKMNVSIEEILYDFGKRSSIDDINQFAEVCKIAKRAGGNLIKIMGHTIACIVDKINVEREIESYISGKKLESRVMVIVLPLILLYMNLAMADMTGSLFHREWQA